MHRIVLASLALTTLAAHTADADCAAYGLVPKLLTPAGSMLTSAAGGIVVAAMPQENGKLGPGDPAIQSGWRFKGNRKPPAITSLAPGLAVIGVPMQADVELVDDKGNSLVKLHAPAAEEQRKAATAPKIKKALYKDSGTRGYHSSEAVTIVFDGALPTGTVAVILRDSKGAKSFGLVTDPTSLTIAAYSHADCTALPNGTRPSKTGDTVQVQFVERDGFTSQASAPIKITAAP
jgi:hypothetical protein